MPEWRNSLQNTKEIIGYQKQPEAMSDFFAGDLDELTAKP
jgi:hypothetical protein